MSLRTQQSNLHFEFYILSFKYTTTHIFTFGFFSRISPQFVSFFSEDIVWLGGISKAIRYNLKTDSLNTYEFNKTIPELIKVRNIDKLCAKDKKKQSYTHQGGHCWIFGSALAMILSYTQNSSIWWAILHGIISWFYVIFRLIVLYF